MAALKMTSTDKLRKMDEELEEMKRKREEMRREAAADLGFDLLDAGAMDVDRGLLVAVVEKLAAEDSGKIVELLGLEIGKGRKSGRRPARETIEKV